MKNFDELEKLIRILKKKRMKVCIAESLTGGQVAYSFVKKEGASEIFDFSIVCYSNDSKRTFLNADKVIKKYGVVSTETANIMLNKIQKFTSSKKRLRLSCTGYA
ncbi:MAG: CinA family protein, partial [Alphaproteobacteria bacterium]